MSRYRVQVSIWPKGYRKQGLRIFPNDLDQCPEPAMLDLEIAEAELLVNEWSKTPYIFEQRAAASIMLALRERERELLREDEIDA